MISLILGAIAIFLLGFLIYLIVPYKWPSKETRNLIEKIPGPQDVIPFIGNMHIFRVPSTEALGVIQKLFDTYGPRVRVWALGIPAVFLQSSKDVQVVLSSNKHIKKSTLYDGLKPWLGDGLLLSTGEKWFLHRKLLTSAFHFKILTQHETVTDRNCNLLLDLLKPHADDGQPFNIYPYITNCAMDIICEAAMGVRVDAQINGSEYARAITRISAVVRDRMTKFWLRHPLTFKFSPEGREHKKLLQIIHGFTNEVIRKRKNEYRVKKQANDSTNKDDETKEKLSFLDLLLEVSDNDSRIGDKEIREEVDTFMFEGHDTTAAAINWCLFLLGNNMEIQEQVLEEVDSAMHLEDTGDRLKNLNLLERCVKETLRIYPSVPGFSRQLTSPLTLDDGTVIPEGTNLPIFCYLIHRDPEVFPDPERFDPDRFLPHRNEGRNPYAYFPFSAGPRNCIGQKFAMMESKLVLASVLSRYKVKSLNKPEDIKLLPELILKPDRPLSTILIERKKRTKD